MTSGVNDLLLFSNSSSKFLTNQYGLKHVNPAIWSCRQRDLLPEHRKTNFLHASWKAGIPHVQSLDRESRCPSISGMVMSSCKRTDIEHKPVILGRPERRCPLTSQSKLWSQTVLPHSRLNMTRVNPSPFTFVVQTLVAAFSDIFSLDFGLWILWGLSQFLKSDRPTKIFYPLLW